MKNSFPQKYFLLAFLLLALGACSKRSGEPKVLVFSKTDGFHHQSISDGIAALQKMGNEKGFAVDTTTNADYFTEDSLIQYSAVLFLNTTGDVLNHYQEADFKRYIQAGGGFVGIHAAADTEHHWGWYGQLVGGSFIDHPGINDPHPNVQEGTLTVQEASHSSTKFLPNKWRRTDEWYSYEYAAKDINVLLNLDENSYKGGINTQKHPIAWYHQFDGGRAFYTGLGHTHESFQEENYLNHLLAGIQYAVGENYKLDYVKAETKRVPDSRRFSKTTLVEGGFFEPTEMTILPDRNILIGQRRGEILFYNNQDSTVSRAGHLDVYWKTNDPDVNAEEGVMGIKADPDFQENQHVFIYYSPADTSVNRLSRFVFKDGTLNMNSEQVVLQFYSKRQICCHTGGSIAFDKEGLLYLSTGDNSTPFNQPDQPYVLDGYAPLDERPGFEQYDAQRTSGNSNDLRGKILRIRVNDDGSYDIPEGNLYPEGMEKTRPEIYVQGNRNPYRISIDQKTGYLYWGEVGPDASNDSLSTRGPRGYDEVNQARKAGFYGWPMFVGKNYAYHRYNYGTGKPGKAFDPEKPINKSPNNTGIKELPPAQPAFIWYPYAESEEFPQVGSGGRNAMAGPVYYPDQYPQETRFPSYYEGKLFIYDWMRGWIKAVTMHPNGDFDKMEPFMADMNMNAPIDMEMGPDGRLYILEYGSGWFAENEDSGLYRIDYNGGNLPPVVKEITVNKRSGTLPLSLTATVEAQDPEHEELKYKWNLGNGLTKTTTEPRLDYILSKTGEYNISVEVRDNQNQWIKSKSVSVYAGNAAPVVNIEIEGNNTFYFPGQPVAYSVSVEDKDDSSAAEDLSTLYVSADYIEGSDMAEASQGHKRVTGIMSGRSIIDANDCQACHKLNGSSIGPSYTAIAERYQDSADASSQLVKKIINGGSGVWGERAMPAHVELSEGDAQKMVAWILSLKREQQQQASLPATGTVDPTLGEKPTENGKLVLSASYTDRGGKGGKPLTGSTSVYLRNSTMTFANARELQRYSTMDYEGNTIMMVPRSRGSFKVGNVDLSGVKAVEIMTITQDRVLGDYEFELRLGAVDGPVVGKSIRKGGEISADSKGPFFTPIVIQFSKQPEGEQDLYLVSKPVNGEGTGQLVLSGITFKSKG